MARIKFRTSELRSDFSAHLWHGEPGAGKTWLMGDALKSYAKDDVYVVNFAGEDGLLTLKDLDLPGETVENMADWDALVLDLLEGSLRGKKAVGFDGLTHFYRLIMRSITQSEVPEPGHYMRAHPRFEGKLVAIRRAIPLTLWTARSDRSMDQVRGEVYVTPDLPGRMAAMVAHHMDFVFYMEANVLGPDKVERVLYTMPKGRTVVRQRVPLQLPPIIKDPTWLQIKGHIDRALGEHTPPDLRQDPTDEAIAEALKPVTKKKGIPLKKGGDE